MINTLKTYIKHHVFKPAVQERDVVEAYDLWADSYDAQPGNLTLDLDELLVSQLLKGVGLENKQVADIGCGTGRHWAKFMALKPGGLAGFDVSPGMLQKLKLKYPAADAHTITSNDFGEISDERFDVIISTLTVAHIENVEQALNAWSRIAAANAEIIITDFHPDILAFGGKRTFKYDNRYIAVQNYVHTLPEIKLVMAANGFAVVTELEKRVDETVAHYYTAQNAQHVFEKFKGFPVIYGLHFKR